MLIVERVSTSARLRRQGNELLQGNDRGRLRTSAYSTISTAAFGQTAQPAEPLLTDRGGNSPPLYSEPIADQMPDAGHFEAICPPSCNCPRWTASADFIILDRVGSFNRTLVERVNGTVSAHDVPTAPGTEILNADDLHQGFSGGPRLGLVHHGDDGNDFEVSYFQIDGWNARWSFGPTSDWLVMKAPGFVQYQNDRATQAMIWDYGSKLYNAEVNARRRVGPRLTVLAGFRWTNLTEDLVGILLPPTEHGKGSFWDNQTKNNLYGFQIGAEATVFESGRFSVDCLGKAGLFDNHVDETTSVRISRIQYGESDWADRVAFLGEVGVQCKYQVTRRLLLRAGYEAMWLQDVALAPGQIQQTNSYYSVNPIDTYVQANGINSRSGAFYHGRHRRPGVFVLMLRHS